MLDRKALGQQERAYPQGYADTLAKKRFGDVVCLCLAILSSLSL